MPSEEHTRAEYLQALLNQKKTISANDGSLLNPSIQNGDNIGTMASMSANMSGGIKNEVMSFDAEKYNKDQDTGNWFTNGLSKIFGFVDEIAAKFGAGFVGAFEGVLDLGATAIGALGDWTGWYDSDPFTKWAEQDIGTNLAEWTKTYANFTPWGLISNIANGNYSNSNYWADMWEGIKDIGGSALFLDNEIGNYRELASDKYYGLNDELETGFGQFVGGVANSIGFMLPSIMLGNLAGAAGYAEGAVKAISLGSMGLSAAGKGSEEALNEGATAGKALGYGAAVGSAEVLSELVVGKGLELVGLGTGKIMGAIGGKTVKASSNSFVKELIKNANEEGMEEISTALVEPLFKAIYKGSDALDEYKDPAKFFFGYDGKGFSGFNESVFGQYAAGAVSGGLMSGVQTHTLNTKYSPEGKNVVLNMQQASTELREMLKYEKGSDKFENHQKAFFESATKAIDAWNKAQDNISPEQLENLRQALSHPNELLNENNSKKNSVEFITDKVNSYKNINEASAKQVFNDFAKALNDNGYTLEFGDTKGQNAFVNKTNRTIVLNKALEGKYGALIGHEYTIHAVLESLKTVDLNSIANQIMSDKWYKANKSELERLYKTEDDTYKSFKTEQEKSDYYMKEIVANYYEDYVANKGSNIEQLQYIQSLFKKKGIGQKLLDAFGKLSKKVSPATDNAITKQIRKGIEFAIDSSSNKTLKSVLSKLKKGISVDTFTSNEQQALKNYVDAFKFFTRNKAAQVISFSKINNLDYNAKLTKAQIETIVDEMIAKKASIDTEIIEKGDKKITVYKNLGDFTKLSDANQRDVLSVFLRRVFANNDIKTPDGKTISVSRKGANKISRYNTNYQREIALYSDKLVQTAVFDHDYPNTKGKGDYLYYDSYIQVNDNIYKANLNIYSDPNGYQLYDINKIEPWSDTSARKAEDTHGSSNNIIDNNNDDSQKKFSKERKTSEYDFTEEDFKDLEFDDTDIDLAELLSDETFAEIVRENRVNEYQRAKEEKERKRSEYESLSNEEKKFISFKKSYERNYEKLVTKLNEKLSEKQKEFFKNSVLRSGRILENGIEKGLLIPFFHGTPSKFMNYFDSKKIGTNGVVRGHGFYLTDSLEMAEGYNNNGRGKVILSFVNITNPLSDSKMSITKQQIKDFVKNNIDNNARFGTLSDWGDVHSESYDSILDKFTESVFKNSDNDYELFNVLFKHQTDLDFKTYAEKFTKVFGYDGYVAFNRAEGTIAVAFQSNQIKTIDNLEPTTDPDIRYSKSRNSEGNALTVGQENFFKDSKVRDEKGNLLVTYHGTTSGDFNVYDKSLLGNTTNARDAKLGFYLTDNKDLANMFRQLLSDNEIDRLNDANPNADQAEFNEIVKQYVTEKGRIKAQYINMVKPLDFTNPDVTSPEELSNALSYAFDNADEAIPYDELYDMLMQNFNNEMHEFKVELAQDKNAVKRLKSLGYDGIIMPIDKSDLSMLVGEISKGNKVSLDGKEYIVFNSNQIKNIDNLNPTENDDIRYSKSRNNANVNNANTVTFKSIETTKEIVANTKSYIENILGKDYKVSLSKEFNNFSHKSFSAINSVKELHKASMRLADLIMDSEIKAMNNETHAFESVGTVRDQFDANGKRALRRAVEAIVKSSPNTEARSNATLQYEKTINRINDTTKQFGNRLENVRIVTNYRNKFRKQINNNYTITEDAITKDGLTFLYKAFAQLHGSTKGYSAKEFANNINETLKWYNETIEGKQFEQVFPNLPYYPEIRQKLIDIFDSLGSPEQQVLKTGEIRSVYGSLSAETLQLTKEAMQMIEHANNEAVKKYVTNLAPSAQQTYKAIQNMSYGKKTGKIAKLFRAYKRGFAPAYVVLKEMLGGNSALANILVTDIQNAVNSNQLYVGAYADEINKKLKELGIKNSLDKVINLGTEQSPINLSMDQAMNLYISLKVDANYNAINDYGVQYYDENGRLKTIAEKGQAEALKTSVESKLQDSYKTLANWLLSTMNDSVKAEYIKMYESRFGEYNRRNEIGQIKENSYWMLNRSYQQASSVEKAIRNLAGIFSHAKARTNNNNMVLIGGALSGVNAYIEQLGKEIYLKPNYRTAIQVLNQKIDGNKNVYQLLKENVDPNDVNYLDKTMNDIIGANKSSSNDVFTKIMSRFSVAKLSLNIGTMLKQFASIWTSNIPLRKSAKAVIAKMFQNSEMKAEYKALVDEIGGLKYRENNSTVVQANADGISGKAERIAQLGMIGISKVDLFTISTGVYSLMIVGQDQFGYKIGSNENKQFVKEQWHDFELSQIGSSALSKNGLSRGDFGSLAKGLFGFLQGANRAALGAQINKIDLFNRNKNVNFNELQETLKNAKAELESAKQTYEADTENDNARKSYIDAQEKVIDLENKVKDYNAFKIIGGKAIPVQMAGGLLAQAVFVTLINQLMKRLKGKKDWDEWDIKELGSDMLLAFGVDWIPLVNSFSSMIQGYEVNVPAVEMLNNLVDIINNGKNGNWETMLRQTIITIGDAFGIPVETVYQYAYGIVKTFDPEIAWEMRSALYGSSIQSATTSLKGYAERGNNAKARSMVRVIMDNYKFPNASDRTITELTNLYMNGYNALPKGYMTSYTNEKGNEVKLTAEQINAFKTVYSQSDKAVKELMQVSEYSSLTQEEKAKLIKKVYDYYYDYAKARITKVQPTNKVSKLLYLTNGNVNIGKFTSILNKIASITDSKTKTRKELVVSYINSLRGLNRQEKVLVMYLAGYNVGNNQTQMVSYLQTLGISKTNAKEFLGIK